MREALRVGRSGEMRWKERRRGNEGTRRWGNEEMGEGGVKSHDGFCSASWGLRQDPHPPVQRKGALLKYTSALFKMKYPTLERKQMLPFIRWLWHVSKQRFMDIFGGLCFLRTKGKRQNTEDKFYKHILTLTHFGSVLQLKLNKLRSFELSVWGCSRSNTSI